MPQIDFIGDIHGHADRLESLLQRLGYVHKNGAYRHPERSVLFVGDYIDRGPDNVRVVRLVREMADAGTAIALMGNHEYNAIQFNTLGPKGYVRPHSIKNFIQHSETLRQYQGKQAEYNEAIAWFRTLPLYYETEDFRAVHATWDQEAIAALTIHTQAGAIPADAWQKAAQKGTPFYDAVDVSCKGIETNLPGGLSFRDKDGTERHRIRLKWWLNPQGRSFQEMSVVEGLDLADHPYESAYARFYGTDEKPVFFGHYWMKGQPRLMSANVCCLDFSVAKGGVLTAYRFDGERTLDEGKFVYV
ncbi:MAG: metallophosphoesterase [Bacteroidota bacterium]